MALRLAELGEPFSCLFTPTGRELPGLMQHMERVLAMTGAPLVIPPNRPLAEWIAEYNALPSHRMRWCTRLIKIEPCIAWLKANPGTTLAVGLRADEESREGLYGEFATYRHPLREWGWGLDEVRAYLRSRGVRVPRRTDCDVCPYQRLDEWHSLWKEHPAAYAQGEKWETQTGHTFRYPGRDSWPASLADLRREFERGKEPRAVTRSRQLSLLDENDGDPVVCRVCSM